MNKTKTAIPGTVAALVLLFLTSALFAAESASPPLSPVAVVPELSYEFQPVVEGEVVFHDFIIQNRGEAILNILDVKTDCGCTLASVSGPIPPGEEGIISVKLNTKGRGGTRMKKTATVTTDDPENRKFILSVEVSVDRIYSLVPEAVKLTGVSGETITQTLSLVPVKGHQFSVTRITAKRGENIKFQYHEVKDEDSLRYDIVVENTSTKVGPYFDTLTVQTDNKRHAQIKIQVFGLIHKPL